ncbi:lipoprotein [Polynucleobacter sp. MWH-P3-07-1]|uniref:LPS translocon maturation chaperone LptM n=1 Tax=Polynucleobacter sp. MWH-P3-07-1 TaxID=1743173 RepID=UPI0035301B88
MIAILIRTLLITLLMSLVGCGVRGPLYLPNVPPEPIPPSAPEPQGILYPPPATSNPNPPPAPQ